MEMVDGRAGLCLPSMAIHPSTHGRSPSIHPSIHPGRARASQLSIPTLTYLYPHRWISLEWT